MSDKRASLEVIAPSVEEAIAKGLAELGLTEDAVEIEVLDTGSRGLFGLGFRQARVRLTIKSLPVEPAVLAPAPAASSVEPAPAAPAVETPAERMAAESKEPVSQSEAPPADTVQPAGETRPVEQEERLLNIARETVEELLKKMSVRARVTARLAEPEDDRDKSPVMVDVRGDDLSILIGPKAETLNALQYIAGLILSKEVGHTVPLVVDVEGYRARRAQQIRQLARRMAEQATRTGRRQVLEPMPANERRLVHIELRDHPDVTTESVGEDPRRKVTIIPK